MQNALNSPNTGMDTEAFLAVESLVQRIVNESPSLSDLSPEQLDAVARSVILDDLKGDLKRAVDLARIPYADLKTEFLGRAKRKSVHTLKAYQSSIEALEAFAARRGIKVLEMKYKDADGFIHSLEGSSSTVRLRVAGASAFFSFLDRETEGRVSNPFRGTRERPKKDTETPNVPSLEDLDKIIPLLKPEIQVAVACMLEHGFRVGALPSLTVWGGRYTGMSKGKKIDGNLSVKALEAIREAGLDSRKPFENMDANMIRNAFRYVTQRLKKEGSLPEAYSVHDLRHFFAISEYKKDRDIYRLKEALNHASIGVTETYLRGIRSYIA